MMMPEHTLPSMVQDHYVARVRELAKRRQETLASLRTRADAERYRDGVLRKLRRCFGRLPKRTPLNAKVRDVLTRDGYTIEKLTFHARPGLIVTANLYRPEGTGPFPVVLSPCGHAATGKAAGNYQAYSRTLAHMGYMVLIYDPLSQGERLQYPVQQPALPQAAPTHEHNMSGKQMSLVGEFFGMWRAWDGIRALDYLLARPEADRSRVGITGNSGGGTLSSYISALDHRFTMAAPSCFITRFIHNLENELPTDAEQVPPQILSLGLDMGDFLIARAPRPVLLLGQEQDFFDRRGLESTYNEVRRFYKLLRAGDRVQLHIGPGTHGYQSDARKAMYRFFNKTAKVNAPARELDRPLETVEALHATPNGQVHRLPDNRLVHSFIRDAGKALAAQRGRVGEAALKRLLPRQLDLSSRKGIPHYRTLQPQQPSPAKPYGVRWNFAIETEPDIRAMLHTWEPTEPDGTRPPMLAHPPADREAMLYLPHVSSLQDVANGQVPAPPDRLLTLDVRGIGQSMAMTANDGDFFAPYGSDYMYAAHGQMLDQSYLGLRVHDVLASLDLLAHRGAKRVHLVGRGIGAILATFAGCLHPLVKQVTLKHALLSYHELTQRPAFRWPLSALPADALHHFDLPDCYRLLHRRKQLRLIEPWDGDFEPWSRDDLTNHLKSLDLPTRLVR
ncbi:alpha/beta hydrolase family protein [Phycisphaerales bacterium AB-hyl4]|uniref:Alpha/beta hydrolase family protein n=1 Tax=Natronomicrosphaera hydrolytica TaxID=3242702 RepID=A0ABV4U414_9BACT